MLRTLEAISAVGDPIGPAPGLEQHLAARPALLLVVGIRTAGTSMLASRIES